ncbi:MAG: phenylalanine--tRNA ligase subunit alpha [Candidatus Thermoplasmatota archaeon]|nr:phenylalanine--tRNA ligase subunit alpha [Candidatus Thermoplasmatota archaeon]
MDIDKIIRELSSLEKRVLLTLHDLDGKASPEDIFEKGNFSQHVEVMNAASWLQAKQLVKVEEHVKTVYVLGNEGEDFLEHGLPERRALNKIIELGGSARLQDLLSILKQHEIPVAIGWLKQKGWATITKQGSDTVLTATESGKTIIDKEDEDEKILRFLSDHPNSVIDKEKYIHLVSRKNVVKEKEIVAGVIQLTEKGRQLLKKDIKIQDEITQITDKVIKEKSWEHKPIRPYDVSAFAPGVHGGKLHPFNVLIDDIRQIFLEMGFQEIAGDFVESSFWNMDVLFIPQDHPAREMQDTFYCKQPGSIEIKDEDIIEKIAEVHKNGGSTGSDGWRYDFSKEEGKRALLRTHTTVNTIRYLYEHPTPPAKIFSIGQVFRKENIDATHLPVFYQIEGIVHDEHATFRQLIGILFEFYKRMGFEKIRFRPAYFPYTEPSMEIEVYWNGNWMELGGSGIFRPEVTEPGGIKAPVLAWGLGLERLAMLKFGLQDIRKLYQSDFDWLRNTPL